MSESAIKSSISDLALVLSDNDGDYFKASLQSSHLNTVKEVYAYTDGDGFAKMFERLASYNEPWKGEEYWESLEGEFKLIAICSALGQVTFKVILSQRGNPEEWSVKIDLLSELGQLKQFAKSPELFLDKNATGLTIGGGS